MKTVSFPIHDVVITEGMNIDDYDVNCMDDDPHFYNRYGHKLEPLESARRMMNAACRIREIETGDDRVADCVSFNANGESSGVSVIRMSDSMIIMAHKILRNHLAEVIGVSEN